MDVDQLQESVRSFSLDDGPRGNQGYSRVLLQLFGYTGHGKSCFINSCKYVLDEGEGYRTFAETKDKYFEGVATTERNSYDLTKNVTIVDNRGANTMSSFQRAEIYAQLGNFLPIGEKVEWMKNFTDLMTRVEDAELNPNYSDFIVPILIYSATSHLICDHQAVKELIKNCVEMTGVVPIVVITHKTRGNFMEMEKAFKLMGAKVIISIENYTQEDHIKTRGKTTNILMILHNALEEVKYHLGEKERNPRKDWVQRKKFLLEYIHKAEMEKRENEIRREEERRREEEKRRAEGGNPQGDSVPGSTLLLEHMCMAEMKKILDEQRRAETRRQDGCLPQ